jgi:hypothetical protein
MIEITLNYGISRPVCKPDNADDGTESWGQIKEQRTGMLLGNRVPRGFLDRDAVGARFFALRTSRDERKK